jgi:hypothetical protein
VGEGEDVSAGVNAGSESAGSSLDEGSVVNEIGSVISGALVLSAMTASPDASSRTS